MFRHDARHLQYGNQHEAHAQRHRPRNRRPQRPPRKTRSEAMTILILFASTFIVVFALGAQSLLVNNGKYVAAFGNSLVIGTCNLLLFKLAPDANAPEIAAFLSGGPLGIVAAMWTFRHLHRKAEQT